VHGLIHREIMSENIIFDGVSHIRLTDTVRVFVTDEVDSQANVGHSGTYMPIRMYAFFSVQHSRVWDVGFLRASDPLCVGQTSGQWVVAKFCHATLQRGLAPPLSSSRAT
jgi:hypothetical protein